MSELLPTKKDIAVGAGVFALALPLAAWVAMSTMATFSIAQPLILATFASATWFLARMRQRGAATLNAREREREVEEAVARIAEGEPAPEPERFDVASMRETIASHPKEFLRMLAPLVLVPMLLALSPATGPAMAGIVGLILGGFLITATSRAASLHRKEQDRKRRALLTYVSVRLGGRDLIEGVELSLGRRSRSAARRSLASIALTVMAVAAAPLLLENLAGVATTASMFAIFATLGTLVVGGLVAKDVVLDLDDVAGHDRAEVAYREALSEHADLIGSLTEGTHVGGGLSIEQASSGGVELAQEREETVFGFDAEEDALEREHVAHVEAK